MAVGPFSGESVVEIHLPKAPLVHVVAQIRFPKILGLETPEAIAPMHAALKAQYPVLRAEKAVGVLLTPDGVSTAPQLGTVWRMQSKVGDWQVSVADTSNYDSRADFVERLEAVVVVMARVFEPAIAERVGIRYVDRVSENGKLARLADLVRPEMLGALAIPMVAGVEMHHSLCENVFTVDDDQITARWGVVPPGTMLDPVIRAAETRSWILDIDVARSGRLEFAPAALTTLTASLAERAYRFFRWAVSDTLITEAGGSP